MLHSGCPRRPSALAMDSIDPAPSADPGPDIDALREAIASGDPARAMPALAGLREVAEDRAIPLLLLGLEQTTFMVRSLACAGLGVKRSESGRQALERSLREDADANVRAEAANALVSHGVERAWPLLRATFEVDHHWLVRCSILSALAEHPQMAPERLLDLAELALQDGDGTVRVGGAEILGRLVREGAGETSPGSSGPLEPWERARILLGELQADPDHRVVAVALDGLQG
jgi:HEAT repeat protein